MSGDARNGARYILRYMADGRRFECSFEFPDPNPTKALELAREIIGDCVSSEAEFLALDAYALSPTFSR